MPPMPRNSRPLLLVAALALWGCDTGPEFVYVPAETYQQALTARADVPETGRLATGEWVTLHANRIMGPWKRMRRTEVPDSVKCRRNLAPPSPDLEIASKLHWQVLPEGAPVKYNLPGPPDYDRQIQFSQPGEYRLWAVSAAPCGGEFTSDTLRITVQ
jgi:hypothetical protein